MLLSVEQVKQRIVSGQEEIPDDEYIGSDGLTYCKKCKTLRWVYSSDKTLCFRGPCKCQKIERQKAEQDEQQAQRLRRFDEQCKASMLEKRYVGKWLKDATVTEHNKQAIVRCQNYVAHAQDMLKNNIGLYFVGDNSTGKTFLTACLCNELMWKSENCSCIYTNFATVLNSIRASYGGGSRENEADIVRKLCSCDFLFIDDLGKEFIGREYNPTTAKWAEEKVFEILNTRYNAGKPTIFSSNYSIGDLQTVLGLDKAIVERISEMATRIIKLTGDDFREQARLSKSEIAKKFGI